MSGEIEAAGALATAGMAAKAIEGGGSGEAHEGACRNCEAPLTGAFCHACGQPAHISRTLGDVFHDFMHSVLHFDTKAWRTLPMLVVRPGTLTNQYIHGKRARFISPLALFLFTIFLMFFVFTVAGGGQNVIRVNGSPTAESVTDPEAARALLEKARAESVLADKALADAEAKAKIVEAEGKPGAGGVIAGLVTGPSIRAEVAREAVKKAEAAVARTQAAQSGRTQALADAEKELAVAKEDLKDAPAPLKGVVAGAEKVVAAEKAKAETGQAGEDDVFIGVRAKNNVTITENGDKRWQDQLAEAAKSGDLDINMGDAKLNEKVRTTLTNPDLALYKLQQTTYKFSFLLVPISLPFIALLFLWRRGVTFFDHVVFSLYSLSFMSLLFIVVALVGGAGEIGEIVAGSLGSLVPPVHMFFHLKGTYALGWWSALWRTVFLLIFVIIAATLFFLAILYLGLAF